jgi:glycosyltransferase involved in cell wall biosynthesis
LGCRPDFVINVSGNGRQSLIKNVYGLNKDKVSVIKNGVNLERFSKDTDSGPLFRNTLGINSDTFVVITPTRIASYKGLDFLIDMVSLGKKFFTDEKVLFLVSVPDYLLSEEEMELFDNFKNKVERLEVDRIIKFTFTKYEEVNNLYNCSDAFLLPSENEQFPMAILEAMASEVPVISTNVGGIPELLITDEDALLVDFGDIISLYKAVETLILKKDNLLSKIAFDKVRRFYSISDIAEKYITTYEKYTPSTK